MKRMVCLIAFALPLALSAFASAGKETDVNPEQRGLEIAQEADRRDSGFQDSRAEVEMVIRKQRGGETRRRLEILVLEGQRGDKTLVRFLNPPDVRGTSLLTHIQEGEEADQWLYLPALKRTKRIASANRSGPFMGSEFAYEDFSGRQVNDYRYHFIREDSARAAWVVERRPLYSGSGYSKQWVWFDKSTYRIQKIEYWDKRDRPLKTLDLIGYQLYLQRFWRPDRMRMGNIQTGDTTSLDWTNIRFRTGLNENILSSGGMGNLP